MKNRLDRVNELIKRELDTLIRREVAQMPGKLVTVREIETSPDLKHTTAWMSILGSKEDQYASMAILHAHRKQLQSLLSKRVVLKFTPQIHFKLDETGVRGDRVLTILSELNLPEPKPGELDPDAETETDTDADER